MAKGQMVPVTARALAQRINRKLVADGQRLKATRGSRARLDLGDYFVVDRRGLAVDTYVDIEELGRELGALQTWESLVEEEK